MSDLINAMVPFVVATTGVSLFLGLCSMLVGYLLGAVTGRNERGRFF